jgi:hypothetical protein
MNHEPLGVVAVLVYFLTYVTSAEAATILGPYAAIIVSASAGASISLSIVVRGMPRWWQPMAYILSRIAIATVLTVAIAESIHVRVADMKTHVLLVFVAIGFGLIWDYSALLRWSANALRKMVPKWLADLGKRDG